MGERHSPQAAGRNHGRTQTAAAPSPSASTKRDPRALRDTMNGSASTASPPQNRLEKNVRIPDLAQVSWGSRDHVAPKGYGTTSSRSRHGATENPDATLRGSPAI